MLPLRYVLKSRISHTTATGLKLNMHARRNMHRAHASVNFGLHGDAVSPDRMRSQTLFCKIASLPRFLSVCSTSKELNVFAGSELWKCMLLVDTFERLQCPPIPAQI
jgi:hypothetical protein